MSSDNSLLPNRALSHLIQYLKATDSDKEKWPDKETRKCLNPITSFMKGNAQYGIQVVNRTMALQLHGEVTIRTEQADNLKDIVNGFLEDALLKENAVQEATSAYEAHKRAYEDLVESCELTKAQVEMFASHYDKNRKELKKATQKVQLFDIEARKHDWYGGNINEVRPD